jgi:diguanylate cyclase (GGDEF)-like protein
MVQGVYEGGKLAKSYQIEGKPVYNKKKQIKSILFFVWDIPSHAFTQVAAQESQPIKEVAEQIVKNVKKTKPSTAGVDFGEFLDSSSGMLSTALLKDRIQQALLDVARSENKVALLMLEVINYHEVISQDKRETGEAIMQELVARMNLQLRDSTTLARIKDNTFAVVLKDLKNDRVVARIARRLLTVFKKDISVNGTHWVMHANIGISLYPDDDLDISNLMAMAMAALEKTKKENAQPIQFNSDKMTDRVHHIFEIERGLRTAITNNELQLLYQPQVDMQSNKIVAVETVLRWKSMNLGLMMASQFIPIAEESGLISQIGEWVIKKACAQKSAWLQQGLPAMRMAVNISLEELRAHEDPVEWLMALLKESKMDPYLLDVEIKENVLLAGDDKLLQALRELKTQGIQT